MVDAGYTAQDHEFRENDQYAGAKYDITLRWLGPSGTPRRRLLNIGCGGGLFNRLATEHGFVVEACEPDPNACAMARADAPDGVTVHDGGLFDAPLKPGADVIVMHDVLEHIQDEGASVARIHELLRPGGTLVLSVPALQSLFGLHDEMLGHYRRYDRKMLRAALSPHFDIKRLRYFGFAFIPVTAWFSRIRRRPYPTGPAGGTSVVGRAFSVVCKAESHVPMPLGTSLVVEATRRP